jgi:hypothetical protein
MDNSAVLSKIVFEGAGVFLKSYAKSQREVVYAEAVRGERGKPLVRESDHDHQRPMSDSDYLRIKASVL